MKKISINELHELVGGDFWADVTYLLGRLYYGECEEESNDNGNGWDPDSYLGW